MTLNVDQLAACTGSTAALAQTWIDPLNAAMALFAITPPLCVAAFLANVGHESMRLSHPREIWGPTAAQLHYEGRRDLGNLRPGDGRKFMGRGPLQVTGRANYAIARAHLLRFLPSVPDFEQSPELLEQPRWGALTSALYWHDHNLNTLAAAGQFDGVCDVINKGHVTPTVGDSNGWPERLALYTAGKAALGIA